MGWTELVAHVCGAFMFSGLDVTIENTSRQYEVDKHLVLSVVYQESRCRVNAVGAVGELGLMQISPRWHHDRMVSLNARNLFDPESNVRVGVDLLHSLGVNSDPKKALAIYNGGYTMPGASKEYANTVYNRWHYFLNLRKQNTGE